MAETDTSNSKKDEDSSSKEPVSKSPTKKETNEALQHLVQGKRHLLVKDINSAVDSLQESCRLFAEQYGETADQCGEAYFVYGKALLELARLETGVIGDVGGESDDDEEEDDEDEVNGDKSPESDQRENGDDEAEQQESVEETASDKTGSEDKDDVNGAADVELTNSDEVPDECDAEDNGKDRTDEAEDDAVSNIQLAWEVLELAKVIFERLANDKESDLKLSQVYLKLGEVSIESENYTQSVTDLKKCLEIQQKHLEPDSRLIAETQYQQGIAHSLANEFSAAISSFTNAVQTIQARIGTLKQQIEKRGTSSAVVHSDSFYKEEDEIKELQDLLPDIDEKIIDMKQMKVEAQRKLAEMFTDGSGPSSLSDGPPVSPVKAIMQPKPAPKASSDEPPKQAQCISHLVKRKRPSDTDQQCQTNGNAKKAKPDD